MALLPRKAAPPRAAFTVPDLADLDASYAADLKRDRDLRARQAEIERELDAIRSAPPRNAAEGEVAALLGDAAPVEPADPTAERHHALTAEQANIRMALDRLRERLAAGRIVASKAAWETLRPEHRRLVGNLCETLAAARDAHIALTDFRDTVNGADVAWLAEPHLVADFLGVRGEVAQHALDQAAKDGFIVGERANA